MEKVTLYEINEQLDELMNRAIDQETGELLPEFEAEFDKLSELREKKQLSVGLYIKNLTSFIGAVKTEEKSLAERRKIAENHLARLKDYLSKSLDGETIKVPQLSVTYRKSQKLEETEDFDMDLIENNFPHLIRIKRELDKAKAKAEIKGGIGIRGLELNDYQNIQIK